MHTGTDATQENGYDARMALPDSLRTLGRSYRPLTPRFPWEAAVVGMGAAFAVHLGFVVYRRTHSLPEALAWGVGSLAVPGA